MPADKGASLTGLVQLMAGDEKYMKKVVGAVGPVAVGVTVTKKFQFYHSGVFFDEKCINKKLNHGVLVVGYGATPKNESYWIVKNSWGAKWGEKGYIKMSRNQGNNCGIASMASIPVV
jgi:cathepsin L